MKDRSTVALGDLQYTHSIVMQCGVRETLDAMTNWHPGFLAWLITGAASLASGQTKSSPSLAEMIDSVKPSVVTIFIKIESPISSAKAIPEELDRCFHGGIYCVAGAGFVVNTAGDVITAFHVVDGETGSPGVKQVIEQLADAGVKAQMIVGVPAPNVETAGVRTPEQK